jgi:bifunctional non-homologous end joining protein LigD
MHVEDHPIEYGTFEGVIPEGYGAGIVMLWDQGTWKPEVEDVDAALKKGDLKFTLDGFKLKGSWVLVRTGGQWGSRSAGGDSRSWLLIKHRDEWAGDVDIIEFAPLSVKSKGNFEDILAADHPDVWKSNRPAKGGEAGAMLATIIERAARLKAGTQTAAADAPDVSAAIKKPRSTPSAGRGKTSSVKSKSAKPATRTVKRGAATAKASVKKKTGATRASSRKSS